MDYTSLYEVSLFLTILKRFIPTFMFRAASTNVKKVSIKVAAEGLVSNDELLASHRSQFSEFMTGLTPSRNRWRWRLKREEPVS